MPSVVHNAGYSGTNVDDLPKGCRNFHEDKLKERMFPKAYLHGNSYLHLEHFHFHDDHEILIVATFLLWVRKPVWSYIRSWHGARCRNYHMSGKTCFLRWVFRFFIQL
jgi:hypothetical protein